MKNKDKLMSQNMLIETPPANQGNSKKMGKEESRDINLIEY